MAELTAEEIQARYDAAMESVNLLNDGKLEDMTNDEWADCVARNVDHLRIMVAKDDWNGQDLYPFQSAISSNS